MIGMRAALTLLGSAGIGALAAALTLADGGSWPAALLMGGAAATGACGLLAWLIRSANGCGEAARECRCTRVPVHRHHVRGRTHHWWSARGCKERGDDVERGRHRR
ncbi:hypothetical protein GCM10009834_02260 [Streptomonospora arabica]